MIRKAIPSDKRYIFRLRLPIWNVKTAGTNPAGEKSMPATLKQIEAFHWVVQLGSFEAAANRLHTTQSAVSKRIAELEAEMGCQLFMRTQRQARLTLQGTTMAAHAASMLELHRTMHEQVRGQAAQERVIRLGATELMGMSWLPDYLEAARERFPGIFIQVEIDHGARLLSRLNQRHFDLALMPGPSWDKSYQSIALGTLRRVWLASPRMQVPSRPMEVEDLSQYPVVSTFPDTVHAQMQAAWFRKNGFVPQRNLYVNNLVVLADFVQLGLGIGLLPEVHYRPEIKAGRLVKIRTRQEFPLVQYFAVHSEKDVASPILALAKMAGKFYDFSVRRHVLQ
jgi:DNA-binding transcriptional LysR family regulator